MLYFWVFTLVLEELRQVTAQRSRLASPRLPSFCVRPLAVERSHLGAQVRVGVELIHSGDLGLSLDFKDS